MLHGCIRGRGGNGDRDLCDLVRMMEGEMRQANQVEHAAMVEMLAALIRSNYFNMNSYAVATEYLEAEEWDWNDAVESFRADYPVTIH